MSIKTVSCPNCGKTVEWVEEQKWRPFCCERCKLIDLGDWAAENHRIPDKTPQIDIEEFNPSDYH
jgi:hypothetical protein